MDCCEVQCDQELEEGEDTILIEDSPIKKEPEELQYDEELNEVEETILIEDCAIKREPEDQLQYDEENDGEEPILIEDSAIKKEHEGFFNGNEQNDNAPKLVQLGNTSEFMFQCSACGLNYKTIDKLEQHVYKDHAVNKLVLYACEHCSFITKTLQSSINHKQKSHPNFICPFCDFTCTARNFLRGHISKHYGRKPSRYIVQKYVGKNEIKEEKPFVCALCKQAFVKAKSLKKHELQAHTFQCGFCDKKLKNKRSFDEHVKNHTDERPFKCGVCEKAFVSKTSLAAHEKRHSLDVQCQYCEFKGSQTKVTTHEANHFGKRYKCEECKFETWKFTILKKHEQVHRRLEKRKCDRCDYIAGSYAMRKKHDQAHCIICDFYSEDNERLNAHMLEVHKYTKK